MIIITNLTSFEAAIENTTDDNLRRMLTSRLRLYRAGCLLDLTMLVVLEPGDTADDVERETGLNPLVNPLDGASYGHAGFKQYCDWLSYSDGHFEWITCAGDAGYATILLAPDLPGINSELLAMFREYAGDSSHG